MARPVGRPVFGGLTALEPEVRWRRRDRDVRDAVCSRAGFTDERRTVVDERSDASRYGIRELASPFDAER